MINVSYAANDAFAWLMGISIFSLLKNNSEENFRIFVLDNKISETSKKKIRQICESFNAEINFIDITTLKHTIGDVKINKRWDFAMYGRLFLPFLLPNTIEKIFYIDCDTIILSSIKSLYETDYDNYAIGGVKDAMSKHYFDTIGIMHDDYMFNSGILIMNLKYMRENNIENRFMEKLSLSEELLFPDQDIINCCIHKNEKMVLPLQYNLYSLNTYCTYKEINTIRKPCNYYSKDEFKEA
ncbi:MAG: glycosyltransferase family 8 protein, partial [Clostridia bacterium]